MVKKLFCLESYATHLNENIEELVSLIKGRDFTCLSLSSHPSLVGSKIGLIIVTKVVSRGEEEDDGWKKH